MKLLKAIIVLAVMCIMACDDQSKEPSSPESFGEDFKSGSYNKAMCMGCDEVLNVDGTSEIMLKLDTISSADSVSITGSLYMREHGHGTDVTPMIMKMEDHYMIHKLEPSMPGVWELQIELVINEDVHRLIYPVEFR